MKNLGKIFEDNWKKSIPDHMFYYRFRDSASSYYGGNDNLRFSITNIADCLVFNGNELFLFELKNHKGKSIPLTAIIGKKSKEKQINDLVDASCKIRVSCYLVVFFCDVERCFALDINDLYYFLKNEDRKSIPITYFEEDGIEIPIKKLKTNYRYDLNVLIGK